METSRYLECLAADHERLRDVAGGALASPVPSCPGWTVADLCRHVAEVYLHKTEAMRRGEWPRPWPPDLAAEEPVALLDRAYAALTGEFAARKADEPSVTWFEPEQTVGFWVRRMAQETVIHRVDGELGAATLIAAIPDDIALDGVDEVLVRFLAYGKTEWAEEFGEQLAACDGRAVRIDSGGGSWLVRLTPEGTVVTQDDDGEAAAMVSGDPEAVLLWLWRRVGDERVRFAGDEHLIAQLRQLLGVATQ